MGLLQILIAQNCLLFLMIMKILMSYFLSKYDLLFFINISFKCEILVLFDVRLGYNFVQLFFSFKWLQAPINSLEYEVWLNQSQAKTESRNGNSVSRNVGNRQT